MTMDVVQSAGDPQVGNLATPINASGIVKTFINNLPAYRPGLSANNRGLEVGLAHGYFLYGPFAILGPLRGSEMGDIAGCLAAVGLISVLTIALTMYTGAGISKPNAIVTAPNPPAELGTKQGWSDFTSGFLLGGCGGAFFAYLICQTPFVAPLMDVIRGVWPA